MENTQRARIYCITNLLNGKQYVGQTSKTLEERYKNHKRDYKRTRNYGRSLYDAMREFGIENFKIELLEECDMDKRTEREIYWIDKLDTFHNGYNDTMGGNGKPYVDKTAVISLYSETKNIKRTAHELGYSIDSVRNVLREAGILIKTSQAIALEQQSKSVAMIDKNSLEVLETFVSARKAATFLVENNITTSNISKQNGIAAHIGDVCNGNRNTAYGYVWKWVS